MRVVHSVNRWRLELLIAAVAIGGLVVVAYRAETTVISRQLRPTAVQTDGEGPPNVADHDASLEADDRAVQIEAELHKLEEETHRLEITVFDPQPLLYGVSVRLRVPSGYEPLLQRLRMTAPGPGLSPLTYTVKDDTLRVAAHGLRGVWASGATRFEFHLDSPEDAPGPNTDVLPDTLSVEVDVELRAKRFALTSWNGDVQFELPLSDLTIPPAGEDTTPRSSRTGAS